MLLLETIPAHKLESYIFWDVYATFNILFVMYFVFKESTGEESLVSLDLNTYSITGCTLNARISMALVGGESEGQVSSLS